MSYWTVTLEISARQIPGILHPTWGDYFILIHDSVLDIYLDNVVAIIRFLEHY